MELNKCKECGKEYYNNLDKCDACGCPTEYNTSSTSSNSHETNNPSQEKDNITVKKKVGFYKIVSLLLLLGIFISIVPIGVNQNKNVSQRWEYKVTTVTSPVGNARNGPAASGAGAPNHIEPSEAMLDQLGNEGWELVTSYLEIETAYPNFGESQYVTGIQPNIRPQSVVMIFRRPI